MVTWDEEIHLNVVLADESPTDDAGASDSGGSVNGLNCADGAAFSVGNEIATIGSDGEGTSSIKYDIDDVLTTLLAGKESRHEVRIEVRTSDMCVEGDR